MKKLAIVLCFLGCVAPAQKGTFTTLRLTWNNLTRIYSVYVPPVLQAKPALVIVLHGAAIVPQSQPPLTVCTHTMGWDSLADANGFLLVCPIASYLPGSPTGRFFWESYGLEPYFSALPDDSGFLRSLMLLMEQPATLGGYSVDPARVFVMGFSSGAMMAQRVCIESADKVAACAVASGPIWVGNTPVLPIPSQPVSIIELHGDNDGTLRYCGGMFWPLPNQPKVPSPSVDVDMNYWLAADGLALNTAPLCTSGKPTRNVFRLDSKSTDGGTEVQFVRESGLGHTYQAWTISSTWEFFSTHGR
jgi:poly(3-hydroxybutyrate) depolymerase